MGMSSKRYSADSGELLRVPADASGPLEQTTIKIWKIERSL
jgi:hypothetical protein